MRKRTDSIEREDEPAFSEVADKEDNNSLPNEQPPLEEKDTPIEEDYVENEDDDDTLNKGNNNKGAVKGNLRKKDKIVSSGIKSARVSSSYGARLAANQRSSKTSQRKSDNWAAASEAKASRNATVVSNAFRDYSTTTYAPTTTQSRKITLITVTPRTKTTASPQETVRRYNLIQMMTSSFPIPV